MERNRIHNHKKCRALKNIKRRLLGGSSLEDIIEGRKNPYIERCRELVPREGIRNCIAHSMKIYIQHVTSKTTNQKS
jgi:hypothetical protein